MKIQRGKKKVVVGMFKSVLRWLIFRSSLDIESFGKVEENGGLSTFLLSAYLGNIGCANPLQGGTSVILHPSYGPVDNATVKDESDHKNLQKRHGGTSPPDLKIRDDKSLMSPTNV